MGKKVKKDAIDIIVKRLSKETGKNLAKQELVDLVNKIAKIHQNKTFSYFKEEDIFEQVWVICLERLEDYIPKRGKGPDLINSLERWLNRVVKNRLHNFYRDNYANINETYRENRKRILHCLPLDELINNENAGNGKIEYNFTDGLIEEELTKFVEDKLPKDLIGVYNDCLEGKKVGSYYKMRLLDVVREILVEWSEINKDKDED